MTDFSLEHIIKHSIDITVSEGANTIDDLYVRPVSLPNGIKKYVHDLRARYDGDKDLDER